MRAILIRPGELGEIIDIPGHAELLKLKEYVSGWIEAVAVPQNHRAIVNEEGHLLDLPVNQIATALFRAATYTSANIVGVAVIVGPTDRRGDNTSVTDEFISYLYELEMLK